MRNIVRDPRLRIISYHPDMMNGTITVTESSS